MSENFSKKFFNAVVFQATFLLLIILTLSHMTWRWKYMLENVIGQLPFFVFLAVCVISLMAIHRKKVLCLMNMAAVRPIIIAVLTWVMVSQKAVSAELFILLYSVFVLLALRYSNNFIKEYLMKTAEMIIDVFNTESRTPAFFALICFICIPFLLITDKPGIAERFAIYAYYFLVLSMVLKIFEVKYNIERENMILSHLKGVGACAKKIRLQIPALRERMFWVGLFLKLGTLVTFTILILVGQSMFWKKVTKVVDENPDYLSQLELVNLAQDKFTFTSSVGQLTISLKITHPASNPRIWLDKGTGQVQIGEFWYEPGDEGIRDNVIFERYYDLESPLLFNSSVEQNVTVQRPPLPGGVAYEVHFLMVSKNGRQFRDTDSAVAKIWVTLEALSGFLNIRQENWILQKAKQKLEEEQGKRLLALTENYRSEIEVLSKMDILGRTPLELAIRNKGQVTWPATGNNSVQIGVLWVKETKMRNQITHIGELTFPLARSLPPGDHEIVKINFDPLGAAGADEVWIGMVQGGKNWFYRWKDGVVKLNIKKDCVALDLQNLQNQTFSILRETRRLKKENFLFFNGINDTSIPDADKYRSKISIQKPTSDPVWMVSYRAPMVLDLTITNKGKTPLPPGYDKYVSVGMLWFKKGSNPQSYTQAVSQEHFLFPSILKGGESLDLECKVIPKVVPGKYEVWIGLVHEGRAWFYEKGDAVLKLDVIVE